MDNVLIRKLQLFGELAAADKALLGDFTKERIEIAAGQNVICEGDQTRDVYVVSSGLACRNQFLADGRRQITAFLLPGDFCDLHISTLNKWDHNISALCPTVLVRISRDQMSELLERPAIARALWRATLVGEAIQRAALVSLGKRSGETRIAHLLCELFTRMSAIGLVEQGRFHLPLTQADLSDAMGITPVHINRCLQAIRLKRLIIFKAKTMTILDFDGLQQLAGFRANYLHLDSGKRNDAG